VPGRRVRSVLLFEPGSNRQSQLGAPVTLRNQLQPSLLCEVKQRCGP
jgi:hypothetical protein